VIGVHAANLTAANFEFNLEPMMLNTGTMTIANGAILPLGGVIENTGTIALGSTGSETDLQILVESVTLHGGGHVVLSDDANNVIFGGATTATLINLDNRISGAGQIGVGQMTLVNAGTIVANGTHALVIDTGSSTVTNTGSLEATGSGVLSVESSVAGHGSATIDGHGTIAFGAASDANVGFAGAAGGALTLAQAAGFTGTIAGLSADDTLHFGDIAFSAATQLTYTANAARTAGSLVVSDGTHTAQLSLIGDYTAVDFHLGASVDGHAQLTNTVADNATVLGTAGADVLVGNSGNDILIGGQGSDTLTGGAGSDTFMFRSSDAGSVDTITDFDAGAGGDMLGIGALLQGYVPRGDLSQFVSSHETASGTIVSIDVDGAGSAHGFHDLLLLQGVTGLDFSTLIGHVDAAALP
jgi:Ca2+-binding RTX toxin-like protein